MKGMPQSKRIAQGALFDIKPVDASGSLDVRKIESVVSVVNLSAYRPKKVSIRTDAPTQGLAVRRPKEILPEPQPESEAESVPAPVPAPATDVPRKRSVKNDFDTLINDDVDFQVELAKIGGQTSETSVPAKPRYRIIHRKPAPPISPLLLPGERDQELPKVQPRSQNDSGTIVTDIPKKPGIVSGSESPKPADPQLDRIVSEIEHSARIIGRNTPVPRIEQLPAVPTIQEFAPVRRQPVFVPEKGTKQKLVTVSLRSLRISSRRVIIAVAALLSAGGIIYYVSHLKHQVIQESASAVEDLQSAHDDLKSLNFQDASHDFIQAYQNFSKAGDSLNFMGATITDLFAQLPGAGSVKSAKNLVKVGQLLADAGSAMTQAMDAVAKTGIIFDPTNNNVAIGSVIGALKEALLASKADIGQANSLLADVDESIIPDDKRAGFDDFRSKLPLFDQTVSESADYAKFFGNLIDVSGSKRYLILFPNSSELRPAGGFPGTYGIVSFKDGKLDDFFVDDVYNLDGQLKENIIPPLQLQHITPNWGMRDANWFIDFPTSARKIEGFYQKESGQSVDGVIAVNPELISSMLDIVGPVSMPQYDLTLDSKNVLTTIQDQVEYGANRDQPKQIVKDFAPLLLKKIYSAKSDQWLSVFNALVSGMDKRQILMYFNNLSLESFVSDKGFGGQVQRPPGDYLMATITNIKGSKTDAVTDTSFALDTVFDDDAAIHTLTIVRQHNGGHEKFGFYNKQNPAYMRILVPDGAELISVSGNDKPNFSPLIDYQNSGFQKDADLANLEKSGEADRSTGVTTYSEAGKTEFGFWMITDPGQTKTVTVRYKVSGALADNSWQLYIQKQPGLEVQKFALSMSKPSGLIPTESYPLLNQGGVKYDWTGPLDNDLQVKVNFK